MIYNAVNYELDHITLGAAGATQEQYYWTIDDDILILQGYVSNNSDVTSWSKAALNSFPSTFSDKLLPIERSFFNNSLIPTASIAEKFFFDGNGRKLNLYAGSNGHTVSLLYARLLR